MAFAQAREDNRKAGKPFPDQPLEVVMVGRDPGSGCSPLREEPLRRFLRGIPPETGQTPIGLHRGNRKAGFEEDHRKAPEAVPKRLRQRRYPFAAPTHENSCLPHEKGAVAPQALREANPIGLRSGIPMEKLQRLEGGNGIAASSPEPRSQRNALSQVNLVRSLPETRFLAKQVDGPFDAVLGFRNACPLNREGVTRRIGSGRPPEG